MNNGWKPVATALLGSWPSQVAAWGREALGAFLDELQARGVTPEAALVAIRCCPAEQKFPPSAPELAAAARRDPSKPTFAEALVLIQSALRAWNQPLQGDFANEAQMLKAREQQVADRAKEAHPLVSSFIGRYGVSRLQDALADLADETYGGVRRKALQAEWARHCEAQEGREVAAIVAPRRGELDSFDPLVTLGAPRRALESGS